MRKMNGSGGKKKKKTKKSGGAKVSVKTNNKSTVNKRTPADYKRYRKDMKALKDRRDRKGKHISSNTNVGTGKPGAISKVKSGYKYKKRK